MTDTEKVTVNLSVVDLGQMDLLVDQGLYSNRTDLIRTAIRNQVASHAEIIKEAVVRKHVVVGVLAYTRSTLEAHRDKGERLDIRVLGMANIPRDVTPELARATINSIKVYGTLRASPAVKDALAGRMI